MRAWLAERGGQPGDPLFVTSRGGPLSLDALQQRLAVYAATAARTCPALAGKNITPHILRHTAAMRLLHAGTDITVIALWLGHENITTTQIYLQADMALKQQALDRTTPRQPRRAATSRPTSCWPSWKPCDYADIPGPPTPPASTCRPVSA